MLPFNGRDSLRRLHQMREVPLEAVLPKRVAKQMSIVACFQPLIENELQVDLLEWLDDVAEDLRVPAIPAHVPLDPSKNRTIILPTTQKCQIPRHDCLGWG